MSRAPWPTRHRTLVKVAFRLALIFMTLSLFVCRQVSSAEEMADVRFGWPVPFVSLDARDHPPASFPRCVRLGDPRRHRARIRPLAALTALVLSMAVVIVATLAWRRRAGIDRHR